MSPEPVYLRWYATVDSYLWVGLTILTDADHPYILAFSLIMLHTDAFNKSNKRKMTKADYIKNIRLPGVYSEVLDVSAFCSCFFSHGFKADYTSLVLLRQHCICSFHLHRGSPGRKWPTWADSRGDSHTEAIKSQRTFSRRPTFE